MLKNSYPSIIDNDDGEAYKTIIIGKSAHETIIIRFNDTANVTTL